MKSFTGTAIAAEEIPHINVFVLVLAERRDGGGQRLEIQKALTAEEQDGENGQDTYCICTESGAAHYGGIAGWVLGECRSSITFDDGAAAVFGAADLVIHFASEDHATGQRALARLLESGRRA